LAGLALVGVAEGKLQEAKEIIDSIKVRTSTQISWHIKSNVVLTVATLSC
jgi:hypothetical protein